MINNLKIAAVIQIFLLISSFCACGPRPCKQKIDITRACSTGKPLPLKKNICYHVNISNASTVYYTHETDKDFTIYISRYYSGQGYIQMNYSGNDRSFKQSAGFARSGFMFSYFSNLSFQCSAGKQKESCYFSIRKHGSGNQKYILSIQ